jgi:peroxiredoxin
MRRPAILLAALMIMADTTFPAVAEKYAPKVGAIHPDFTLPRIDDRQPVSLSDFRGKKVLLIQFASW